MAVAEVVAAVAVAAAPDGRPQPAVGAEAEAVAVAVPGVRAKRVQPAERASALPRVSAVVEAERPVVFAPVPAFSG